MAYASKYYDPVKRHEYYMKHRQLKGRSSRSSTASLNEDGKIAAKEVKEGIKNEQKEFYQILKDQMNAKINALRAELKAMTKEQRKARKEEYKQKIAALRQETKEHKAKAKEYFQEKYLQELDKIKQDTSFVKYKKKKSKKK